MMNVFAVSVVEVAAGGIVLAEVVADTIHHPARMGWGRCSILFPDNKPCLVHSIVLMIARQHKLEIVVPVGYL